MLRCSVIRILFVLLIPLLLTEMYYKDFCYSLARNPAHDDMAEDSFYYSLERNPAYPDMAEDSNLHSEPDKARFTAHEQITIIAM